MKYLFILMSLFAISCVTQKKCTEKFPCVSGKDSIYIQTSEPFPVEIETDTMYIETKVPCNDFELKSENRKLLNELKVVNGILKQKVVLKPDTVIVYVPKIVEKVKEVTKPVQVKFVPLFWRIFGWVGISTILGLIIYLGLKIKF